MRDTLNITDAYQLLHEGTLALARAEQQGLRVDTDYIATKKAHLTRKIKHLEDEFKKTTFFKAWQKSVKGTINIHSGQQLGKYLYNVKGLKVNKQTASGQGATDDEALKQLNIPELNGLLEARKLKKIRDTYLDSFDREQVDGYMHPFFNLHLVVTYRSSSNSPNFQNIPKRDKEAMKICRKALYPRIDHQLMEFDFSGAEIRIAACYHKDPTMLKYLTDKTSDMHGDLAKQIFMVDKFDKHLPGYGTLRQAAKNGFIFPEFYGDYYKNCAESLACTWGQLPKGKWKAGQGISLPSGSLSDHMISKGITELGTEKRIGNKNVVTGFLKHVKAIETDFWENRFPVYAKWKESHWTSYQRNGSIDFLTGFKAGGLMGKNNAINYPVQGASFHCLLWSLIQLDKVMIAEKWDSRIVGQIHDSIVMDICPAERDHVIETVSRIINVELPAAFPWIIVPMEFDYETYPVNGSWNEAIKEE